MCACARERTQIRGPALNILSHFVGVTLESAFLGDSVIPLFVEITDASAASTLRTCGTDARLVQDQGREGRPSSPTSGPVTLVTGPLLTNSLLSPLRVTSEREERQSTDTRDCEFVMFPSLGHNETKSKV